MVISIKALVSSGDTAAQGMVVYACIVKAMRIGGKVTVDFDGIMNITSSFANTAFVPLLDEFSFGTIKARLVIQGSNRQISNMIRDRMTKESERKSLAA